jgi:two-component system NtrC family sensor kinase
LKFETRNIEVVKDLNHVPDIYVDARLMQQVLINVVTNSLQAMPDGGRLIMKTMPTDNHVVIRITDTGVGIPEEDLTRIFDPFFTTKGGKGTGLGLYVAYGIIKKHGGVIEVESEVGKGSTFTIKLPRDGENGKNPDN